MKKLAILALAGLIFLTAGASTAAVPDLNNQTECNTNHVKCREYTMTLDAPWYKVMVLLTACDVAFVKCMMSI